MLHVVHRHRQRRRARASLQRRDQRGHAGEARRGGLHAAVAGAQHGLQRCEAHHAQLAVEQLQRGVRVARGGVVVRQRGVRTPAGRRVAPGLRHRRLHQRGLRGLVVAQLEVVAPAARLVVAQRQVLLRPRLLLLRHVLHALELRRQLLRRVGLRLAARLLLHHAVERRAGHLQHRPLGLLVRRRGWRQQLRGRLHRGQRDARLLQLAGDARGHLLAAVGLGGDIRERELSRVEQHADACLHVVQVQRVAEAAHHVAALLRDLQHLAQLLQVARDRVQEGQLAQALRALVARLHHAAVALAQRLLRQLVPDGRLVQLRRTLDGALPLTSRGCAHLQIAAADGQVEARARLGDEVQRDVLEAVLL